jgi:hypothetical protein
LSRSKRLTVFALVLLAGLGLLIARRRPPPAPRIAPGVAYRDAPVPIPTDEAAEDRAFALAVGSLTPAERKRLLEAIEYAAARLEGRLLPGADDLGEGDPVTELQTSTKKYLPALSAARSLARNKASAKDLSVRVVPSCDDPSIEKDEKCAALWASDAEGSRARFLAWAASNAAVLEVEHPAECVTALREHAIDDTSPIALVLASDDLGLAMIPERDALKAAAHRLGRALGASERKDDGRQLEALGRAAPAPARALPWLDATPKTVMIVPRLSALTRLGELNAAVERSPACRPERWLHRAGG